MTSPIHVVIVACEDRVGEALVLMKSVVLFTNSFIIFQIFTDDDISRAQFQNEVASWPYIYRNKVELRLHAAQYPDDVNENTWRKIVMPCTTLRLFLPNILRDVDSVLYIDTDIVFLTPAEKLWNLFNEFNSTQIAAVAPETLNATNSYYQKYAKHPYYPPQGVNAGVMLMNLTRMRSVSWVKEIERYYRVYRKKIRWGDQDLINIYFHFFQEQLYVVGCQWNYRRNQCSLGSICKAAELDGVRLLHGNRRTMQNEKEPIFKTIYKVFKEHDLERSLGVLLESLIRRVGDTKYHSHCANLSHIYVKNVKRFVQRLGPESKEL